MARGLPFLGCEREGIVSHPLFDFLFLTALIVPAAMYICGLTILIASLIVKHHRETPATAQAVEALAH